MQIAFRFSIAKMNIAVFARKELHFILLFTVRKKIGTYYVLMYIIVSLTMYIFASFFLLLIFGYDFSDIITQNAHLIE